MIYFWCFIVTLIPYSACAFTSILSLLKAATGPRYDGTFLHSKVKELLGKTKLHQSLTNVVIPTFDIKLLQPAIFSTFEVQIISSRTKLFHSQYIAS